LSRDAEEIETPKALRGRGSQLGGLGSVVSCPSGVRGGAPAENEFWCILSLRNASDA